jgi:hypothetical protein
MVSPLRAFGIRRRPFCEINLRAGTGTLTFPDPGDDPVARLAPVRVNATLYGSLDDFYPETLRILR